MSNNSRVDEKFSLRRLSFKSKQQYENYHYVYDFDKTTEKECKKMDSLNDQIFQKNLKYFVACEKYLTEKKAMFSLSDSPNPPDETSNFDNLVLYKRRNEFFNCKEQSLAVIYLIYNNYTLVIDKSLPMFKNDNTCFEPYMAMDLAKKIARQHSENYIKVIETRINDENECSDEDILVNHNNNSNSTNNTNNTLSNSNTSQCSSPHINHQPPSITDNNSKQSHNAMNTTIGEKRISVDTTTLINNLKLPPYEDISHLNNESIIDDDNINHKINHFNNTPSFYPNLNNYLQQSLDTINPQQFSHQPTAPQHLQHNQQPPTAPQHNQQPPTAPQHSQQPQHIQQPPTAPQHSQQPQHIQQPPTAPQHLQHSQQSTHMNTYNNQQMPSMMTNNFMNDPVTISNSTRNYQNKRSSIKEKLRRKQNVPIYQININSGNKSPSLSPQSSDSDINI